MALYGRRCLVNLAEGGIGVSRCQFPRRVASPSLISSLLQAKDGKLSEAKLDVGSEVAGALGGKNAHTANMVAAMFLATGQVP